MTKPYHAGRFAPAARPAPDWRRYEYEKYLWHIGHPDATPAEYEAACTEIAKRLGI